MLPLNDHFDGLMANLNPPNDRQDLAEDLPTEVRDHLARSEVLATVADPPVSRLAGSYGRRTVSGDIKDVDVLVFVDEGYEQKGAEAVLDDLAAALKDLEVEGYGKGEIKTNRKQRRSHHVEFKQDGGEPAFHVDVVPVIRPGDDPTAILQIPDREWTTWVPTQPLGYAKRLSEANADWGGEVVPMIRFFKRIKAHNMKTGRPKSYWSEAMVYRLFADEVLPRTKPMGATFNRAERMLQILREVHTTYGQNLALGLEPPAVADPCLGNNIAFNWPAEDYRRWVTMIENAIATLEAIQDSTDRDASIKAWHRVFGDDVFKPIEEDVEAEAARAKAIAAAAKVAGGAIMPAASTTKGIVVPAHRAYGDR